MGLWQLHDNGTKVTNSDGQHIPTYIQDDVVNFARAWTGLTQPLPRANYEGGADGSNVNTIDPMRMRMVYRDTLPKTDLLGGYIGDGHPLCEELPERAFLRRGARYEYLGATPAPRKSHLSHPKYGAASDNNYIVRLELHRNNSELYDVLCSPDASDSGRCRFQSEVQLPRTVTCNGKECSVDTAVVVKLGGAGVRTDGTPFDVFYEYVRQPCVDLSYFDTPVIVAPRFFRGYGGVKPMCANPRVAMAAAGCCPNTTASQKGNCVHEYSDELVTLATAEARCQAYGSAFEPCAKDDGLGLEYCTCPRGGEVRYGSEDVYSSNWSAPVSTGRQGRIACSSASFGSHEQLEPIELSGGDDGAATNLQACRGECDADAQCATGLVCFQRSYGEAIPGCHGEGESPNWDYCYDPHPTVPDDGVAAMCQCRRPASISYSVCDLTDPTGRVEDANAASGCEISYRHFWTGSQPCQMQAQVAPGGLITMVDHIEGPTAAFPGTANMSSEHSRGHTASKAHDGLMYTYSHSLSAGEPNPWWQLDFETPREVGSITVHNIPSVCAARLFDTRSCAWEFGHGANETHAGFQVGVSNASCSADGEGCGGEICGHVVTPTLHGEGHAYSVICDPPVVGRYAYIVLPGENRLLTVTEIEVRGASPSASPRGRFNDVTFKPNAPGTFAVQWQNGSFPRVGHGTCSGGCAAYGTSCLCNVTAVTEAVFTGSLLAGESVPSAEEIEAELRIGAVDPLLHDNGTFVRCTLGPCTSQPNVTVYVPGAGGSEASRLTADTVFAIPDGTAEGQFIFFKNAHSVVQVGDEDMFAFRNPPSFSTRNQVKDSRDGENDIDAVLSHYFNHPTTPPFVAKTMIQRLVTSNPSPRYVEVVAVAFKTGRYRAFGNGTRGDMAAVTAAIYLDREAQSHVLENDPVHGGFREPLVKLIHLLRALELETVPTAPLLSLRVNQIIEFPFKSPTV